MKVSISVPGRFHGFDLARELQKQGALQCLVTSYPSSKAVLFGIDKKYIKSILIKEIVFRGWQKLSGKYPNWFWINELFDKLAAHRLPMDSDIYVLWAGFALHSIRRIRKKNPKAKIIVERGSTHIQFQHDMLVYAYSKKPMLRPVLPTPQVIQKEIAEYDAADYIAIPTTFVEKTFTEKGVRKEKLFINPYGVDLSLFKQAGTMFSHKGKINLLFVGLFSIQKGADIYIKVINKFASNERVQFSFVGGMENGLLEELSPFISSGKVTYQPTVPQERLPEFYSQADIFLFPSYQEGMAMVLLQAMASGLGILASENSGAGMLIRNGENGFMITHEVDAIVEKINCLLDNHALLGKMQIEARTTVENNFSWDDYAERTMQFYSKIAER
jgi:glycosyltransferase involved in cell wall biosynthesis